jgi:hypothetical protein
VRDDRSPSHEGMRAAQVQLDAVDALRGALAELLLDTHTRTDGAAASSALATLLTAAAAADAAEPSLRSTLSHAVWTWSIPLVPAPPDDPAEHTSTDGAAQRVPASCASHASCLVLMPGGAFAV